MSERKMLRAVCPDAMCRAELCFSQAESSVDCFDCGQTHARSALLEARETLDEEREWVVRNVVIRKLVGAPRRGPENVKVTGLSNYYCKLLSPLLTRYGMDKNTGEARLLLDMGQGEMFDCGLFGDRAFLISSEHLQVPGFGRDTTGSTLYLAETLKAVRAANGGQERLVPVHADGDGHCLVHAVSRALVGRELFWHPLRCCLKRHFEHNLSRYKELFCDFVDEEEWTGIIAECDPEFAPPEGELHGLRNIHIFGLANVLRRPIVLLDSLDCMKKCADYSALFLPGFVNPEGCRGKDGTPNKPLCIAWSSFSHNHYIPLVALQKMPLPVLPSSLLPKAWGMPQTRVRAYMAVSTDGSVVVAGGRPLSDAYLHRLVTAMESAFTTQHRVHPMLVADTKFYLCQDTAFLNIKVGAVIEVARQCVSQGRLYRCAACRSLCEFRLDAGSVDRDGDFLTNLVANYQKLEPNVPYMMNGICCKYNPVEDRIVVDMKLSYLEKCTWCNSLEVQKLKPDGTFCDDYQLQKAINQSKLSALQEKNRLHNSLIQNCNDSIEERLDSEESGTEEFELNQARNRLILSDQHNQVQSPAPCNTSKEILLKLQWNDKNCETTISCFALFDKENSGSNPLFKMATNIVNTFFPEESNDTSLLSYVRKEILLAVKNFTKATAQVTSEEITESSGKSTNNNKDLDANRMEDSLLLNSTSAADVQYIKVVSAKGKQVNLALPTEGISHEQLREWIRREFGIPVLNQRIKVGFPPRELDFPSRNSHLLPLKHGDRLIVEDSPRLTFAKSYTKAPYARQADWYECDAVWRIALRSPADFERCGLYYEEANQLHILTDATHLTLPTFPYKTFSYNVNTDSLELCKKGVGHFLITREVETRIEQQSQGQSVPGFRPCPLIPQDNTPVNRRTSNNSESSRNAPLVRKGPGFSVLSSQDYNDSMDFS